MPTRLTIIGSGPGGYVAAIRAAQLGAQVMVVEEAEVGGTCLNWGCIPTKSLIASVDALETARKAATFGVELNGEVAYNLSKIRERKDKIVSTQVKGIRSLFKSNGVNLIAGRGCLLDANIVRVVQHDGTTMDILSDRIIIATGSSPVSLPGVSSDGNIVLSSNDAVLLRNIPKHILIIGAGIIGCEFAFLYRSLGAEVTMVEVKERALSSEDEEISALIERELKKAKIRLITSVNIDDISINDNVANVKLSKGHKIQVDQVLVAAGRKYNTDSLGLADAGLSLGPRGEIPVNDCMETVAPGIFAVGDVTGKMMLAHVASRQGMVAAENALGGKARMEYEVVPSAIFTRPEIGSVGLREHQALQRGIKVRTGIFPYRALGRSHAAGEITGMVKVVADAVSDKVLGVHICGCHAADLVHEGVLAIKMGMTSKQLGAVIHAHPTFAESIMEAAEAVHENAIHLPPAGK